MWIVISLMCVSDYNYNGKIIDKEPQCVSTIYKVTKSEKECRDLEYRTREVVDLDKKELTISKESSGLFCANINNNRTKAVLKKYRIVE